MGVGCGHAPSPMNLQSMGCHQPNKAYFDNFTSEFFFPLICTAKKNKFVPPLPKILHPPLEMIRNDSICHTVWTLMIVSLGNHTVVGYLYFCSDTFAILNEFYKCFMRLCLHLFRIKYCLNLLWGLKSSFVIFDKHISLSFFSHLISCQHSNIIACWELIHVCNLWNMKFNLEVYLVIAVIIRKFDDCFYTEMDWISQENSLYVIQIV